MRMLMTPNIMTEVVAAAAALLSAGAPAVVVVAAVEASLAVPGEGYQCIGFDIALIVSGYLDRGGHRATGPARRHCPRRLPADGVYWIPWQDPCWPPARGSDGRAGPVGAGECEAPAARTVHAFRQPMTCAGASESGGGAGPVYRPDSSAARPSRWRDSFPT